MSLDYRTCDKPGFNGTFKRELEGEYTMWAEENIMGRNVWNETVERPQVKPRFPPESPVWPHCPSCSQLQFNFSSHPPIPEPLALMMFYLQCSCTPGPRAPPAVPRVHATHPRVVVARSRPSEGCSTFTVPGQEGRRAWATSQTVEFGGSFCLLPMNIKPVLRFGVGVVCKCICDPTATACL